MVPVEITRSDASFLEDGVEFCYEDKGLCLDDLNNLFEAVGFPRREILRLQTAMHHTHRVVWARSVKKSRFAHKGQCLGFARATSDGALVATIWDVAVHPTWMRCGIGRGLMERLAAGLQEDGIGTVALYAEPGVVNMYKKLGYEVPGDCRGMAFLRRAGTGARLRAEVQGALKERGSGAAAGW
ncbi:unnamed protein product [Pedinophyceae sp. YPF-701]|nr:unnamed protein product [Pedinophyceae sp. YPF-701]